MVFKSAVSYKERINYRERFAKFVDMADLPTYKITFAGQNVKFCRILQIFAGHPHPIHTTLVIIIMNLQFESVMIAIAS